MHGPQIIARSLSAQRIADKFGNLWQYHPRSDNHSKIACWALMFDLLAHCQLLRKHIEEEKVGFGINHELGDWQTKRRKNLDLVICTPGQSEAKTAKRKLSFAELGNQYRLELDEAARAQLTLLPHLRSVPVGSVHVALEAKATMTAHIKSLPRLHDELDSSHLTIHGHADPAIASALVLVNVSPTFLSPMMNNRGLSDSEPTINRHNQPRDAERTIAKIEEIRRRVQPGQAGFDAVGIVLIDFKNDGSACELVDRPPAPQPRDPFQYGQMIHRLSSAYTQKFAAV